MTGKVPSYLVRNLVEVTLSRTGPKPSRKASSNNTLCLAIPTDGLKKQVDNLQEIKALLKLHKRYETEAERVLYNGVAKTDVESGKRLNPGKLGDNAVVLKVEAEPKNLYLREIQSKWSLPPSPLLPTLPSPVETSKQLVCSSDKRLSSGKTVRKLCSGVVLPALTDKPFYSAENRPTGVVLQKNSRPTSFENFEKDLNLEGNLTIVPLSKKNFASYDSLPTLCGGCANSNPAHAVGMTKNRQPPVRMLRVSVSDSRSEDGLFVDFDEYMKDIGYVASETSSVGSESELDEIDGGCEIGQPGDVGNGPNEQSLALVEYRPSYRKNVHFSEALHEVHLYSPVQNHRRRRRHRRHHTENSDF